MAAAIRLFPARRAHGPQLLYALVWWVATTRDCFKREPILCGHIEAEGGT